MFHWANWVMSAGVAWMMLMPPTVPADDTVGARLLYVPEVSVVRFEAAADEAGQVWLRWVTDVEMGSGVFRVRRQRPGGSLEPVGSGGLRLQGDGAGCDYVWRDAESQLGETLRYVLVFVPHGGVEAHAAQWEGVVARIKTAAVLPSPAVRNAASVVSLKGLTAPQAWIGNGPRVRGWTGDTPADRVRFSLRETGVYRVTARELSEAGGWGFAEVISAMAATNLSLSCQGEPVAWLADGEALLFYGVPAESRFAPENVYWVAPGRGTSMALRTVAFPPDPVTNAWFEETRTFEGTNHLTRVSYNSRTDLPFLAYTLRIAGQSLTVTERLDDCAPGAWMGTVSVSLLSYFETGVDEHAVQVSLGGVPLGRSSWSGEQLIQQAWPFASTNLSGGQAAVTVSNISEAPPLDYAGPNDYTRYLWMSSRFTYPRVYRARDGALRCRGGDGNFAAISGLPSNDVVVLEVTANRSPEVIEPVALSWDGTAEGWTAGFPIGSTGQTYQVFSVSAGVKLPSVRGVRDADWSSPANCTYAILVPPEGWCGGFREAIQPLADARNEQGLPTRIVDVESLYNAFSHGLVDPLAIRSFCAEMRPNGLRYLLLAGAGSFDFQHRRLSVGDYTACLIPTLMAGQRFPLSGEDMVVAVDGELGDVNGDGVPELAIGRLPTASTQAVAVAVQKTLAYESTLRWKAQAAVTADWDCSGITNKDYLFSAGTDLLVAPLAADGRTVRTFYTSDPAGSLSSVRMDLLPAMRTGTALFHFFGHANEYRLGYRASIDSLLRNTDITPVNWQPATIAVLMCCLVNRWQSPYSSTPNVFLPYGLFASGTGFVAGLGSTGYLVDTDGERLPMQFYAGGGATGVRRLGDLWLRGMQNLSGVIPRERLLSVGLIGDPCLLFDMTPDPRTVIILK